MDIGTVAIAEGEAGKDVGLLGTTSVGVWITTWGGRVVVTGAAVGEGRGLGEGRDDRQAVSKMHKAISLRLLT